MKHTHTHTTFRCLHNAISLCVYETMYSMNTLCLCNNRRFAVFLLRGEKRRPYCCFHYTCATRACEFLTRNFSCSHFCDSFQRHPLPVCVCTPCYHTQFWRSDYPYGQNCRSMHTYHPVRALATPFQHHKDFSIWSIHNPITICYFWSKASRTLSSENAFECGMKAGWTIHYTLSVLIYYDFIAL